MKMNGYLKQFGALLLTGASFFASAQNFQPVIAGDALSPGPIVIDALASNLPVRFVFARSVNAGSDFFPDGNVITPLAGTVTQSVRFGTTAGVRIIQFCQDPSAVTQCNPLAFPGAQIVHYAAVRRANCTLTPSTASVIAPASQTITAACPVTAGTDFTVEQINYNWSLSGPTPTPPPASTATTLNLSAPVAGTYGATITPSYSVRVTRGAPFNDSIVAAETIGASPVAVTATITATAAHVPPTVSLTAPANNAIFTAPAAITLTATAADSDGTIQRVEFLNGATVVGTVTAAPYSFTWPNVAAGTYSLTARATDNANAQTTSAAVSVTVNAANQPPTVALTSPANNATFTAPANVTLQANAADPDGTIQFVEFEVNGTVANRDTTAPYSFDLTNLAAGTYNVRAIATDNGTPALSATSATITFTVAAPNQPPTTTITAPANNANFTAPATINIQATAADSDGTVARVEFYNGNALLSTSTSAPYQFSWPNVPAGNYVLTARAFDNLGAQGNSSAVNISVGAANVAPTVSITAPANNAVFTAPAAISIQATATDTDGTIARVEFYNGAALLGTATAAPYVFTWPNVAAGSYVISARAFDNLGARGDSANVAATVNPRANVPPTVSITAPTNGATFTSPAAITIQASAADSDGSVARVEFFNGTAPLGTSTTAPYTFTWTNVPAGSYSITARATDNQNATTTSAAVSVSVQLPAAPTIACGVEASPARIGVTEGVTFKATCTRNGAPLNVGNGETLTYAWTAGAQSPPIPTGAQRGDMLILPPGTFKRAGTFDYRVVITLSGPQFSGVATSNDAVGQVLVDRSVGKIEIVTPAGGLKLLPGVEVTIGVKAMDDQGGIPGVAMSWRIDNGDVKAKSTSVRKAGGCEDVDKPNGGALAATNAAGETTLKFVPSCASGGRTITVTAGNVTQAFTLTGPDQAAAVVRLMGDAQAIVVEPGKFTSIPVLVEETKGGAKVASATTVWSIVPTEAGVATSPAVSNANGEARSTVVLKAGFATAVARVCIEGRPSTCIDIPVRSSKAAVEAPALAVLQPMARQSVDAPRVQIQNIRNRLQQLRVEESSGNGGSDKSGGGGLPKVSGLGLFMMGDVEIAKRDPNNGDRGYKLRTKGVTIGADYRPTKELVVGGAVGLLRGDTSAGDSGDQKSKGISGSVFTQWVPAKNWYANMIVNVGRNTYDNSRTSIGGDVLKARGSSTQQGFQMEGGYSLVKDATRLTPYLRYQFIRAKLKPFEESGGADAVAITGQTLRSNTFGLGAVAEHAFSTSSGVWIPSARLEYVNESQKQSDVYARLVNGTPILVPLNPELVDKSYGVAAVNLQWLTGVGSSLTSSFIGYEQTIGKTGFKSDRFTAGVKIPF
jgi:uncharacterized protein YhjY with autotransporter beta-barrel domain